MEQKNSCPPVSDRASRQLPLDRLSNHRRGLPVPQPPRAIETGAGRHRFTESRVFHLLFPEGRHHHYSGGAMIRAPGEAAQLGYLMSGLVALRDPAGPLLDLVHPGEFFDETHLFDALPADEYRVSALIDCWVLKFEPGQFFELARRHPELGAELTRHLVARLALNSERAVAQWSEPVRTRIWKLLQHLAQNSTAPQDQGFRPLRLRRKDLADLAGCCRKQASVALHRLADAGRIRIRGHRILVQIDGSSSGQVSERSPAPARSEGRNEPRANDGRLGLIAA